jgi:hypothetical protein
LSLGTFEPRGLPAPLLSQPLENIQVVTVRIAKANYPRCSSFILRFTVEDDALGFRIGVDAVNIFYSTVGIQLDFSGKHTPEITNR